MAAPVENGHELRRYGVHMSNRPIALIVAACWFCWSGPGAASDLVFECPELETTDRGTLTMTQGTDGWFFRTGADLKDDFYLAEETKTYFRRLVAALAEQGTTLFYLPVPPRGLIGSAYLLRDAERQTYYRPGEAEQAFKTFVEDLRSTGMIVPNIMDYVAAENLDPSQAFFKRDHHWTPEGARLASQAVGKALTEFPDYEAMSKASYQSSAISELQIKQTMAQEIQRLCQAEIPPEPYAQYETRQLAEGGSNEDLFGSSEDSGSLVLVGTSFSAEGHFNFDGFLSESTGLEVANHAISGGQLFNAVVSFTASPQFEETEAPFMLWEAPSYYNLNRDSASAFRQIIPAVQGACAADEALATSQITVRQGEASGPLTIDPTLAVSGNDYYLYLETANRAVAQFTVKIDYDDGDFEWFAIDRTENFRNWGRFFVEFSEDIESNVSRISLSGLAQLNAEIEARICRASTVIAEESTAGRLALEESR